MDRLDLDDVLGLRAHTRYLDDVLGIRYLDLDDVLGPVRKAPASLPDLPRVVATTRGPKVSPAPVRVDKVTVIVEPRSTSEEG